MSSQANMMVCYTITSVAPLALSIVKPHKISTCLPNRLHRGDQTRCFTLQEVPQDHLQKLEFEHIVRLVCKFCAYIRLQRYACLEATFK